MGQGRGIVVGVSGSIAAVKSPELIRLLVDKNYDVTCVLTPSAEKFVAPLSLSAFSGKPAISSLFGEESYQMPHLKLAGEADLLVVAPASATVLARCARGLAEDMISLLYITTTAPVVFAPAMHPTMWEHPATQENVKILRERGAIFTGPFIGPLADKTRGEGRMSEPADIVQIVEQVLKRKKD